MTTRWRPFAEWIGFQLVWLACAMGAAQGRSAPAVIAASAYIAAVLGSKRWPWPDGMAVLASGITGLIVETALVAAGVVRFSAPWPSPHWAPVWIVALWLAFGVTLSTMAPLFARGLAPTAALAGAIAGPLAYWAGARLGALEIASSAPFAYGAIALAWAAALPGLLMLRQRLAG